MTPLSNNGRPSAPGLREGVISPDFSLPTEISGPRRSSVSAEFQRVFILVGGGVICLTFLLLLARSMNPPDEALKTADLVAAFAPLDGVWVGQSSRIDANGDVTAQFSERREFQSSSAMVQTSIISRTRPDGSTSVDTLTMREHADGTFTASSATTGRNLPPYKGQVETGSYFWTRRMEDRLEIIRYWVSGNSLQIEEIHMPLAGGPDAIIIISGRLQRVEMVDR